MKDFKTIIIFFVLVLIIVSIDYSKTSSKTEIVCVNKEKIKLIYGKKQVFFKLKNKGDKIEYFHLGLKAVRNGKIRRIVPDILLKNNSMEASPVKLLPNETKTIKWIIPFDVYYRGRILSNYEEDLIDSQLYLFLWKKDPFDEGDRKDLCRMIMELKTGPINFYESFIESSNCIKCLNKKRVFKENEKIYFRIKNKCDTEQIFNLAVMTKDEKGNYISLASTNAFVESEWISPASNYKAREEKIILWNTKYGCLYGKLGVNRFDKRKIKTKDIKNGKYYLFYYLDTPYKKMMRKLIFVFELKLKDKIKNPIKFKGENHEK